MTACLVIDADARRRWRIPLAILASACALSHGAEPSADTIQFNRDIRPILADHCFACHGFDKNKRQADLRLDQQQGLLGEGGSPGVVLPGDPDQSELWRRIQSDDDDERMPPAEFGKDLSDQQQQMIRQWIEQGAEWQGHWSFQPILDPPIPTSVAKHPIDAFVRAQLATHKLTPAAQADRVTLARRLHFDLTGLPPTAETVEAFVENPIDEAYEELVDRLLSSPQFGERMAMWWLDLVRYADSVGYHGDQPVSVFPYREYVIESFNTNKPFDQFTVEQLAGDLFPEPSLELQIASGYNRLGMMSAEGGVQPKEYLAKYIAERVRNVSGTWLGVTMGCCECHDHKFDPLATRDFYAMEAFFADIEEQGLYSGASNTGNWGPTIQLPTHEQAAERARLLEQISQFETAANPNAAEPAAESDELKQLKEQLAALDRTIPTTLVTRTVAPRTIRVLSRGNWMDETGEIVQPAVPQMLPQPAVTQTRPTRMDLARWLVSRDNPLTPRVFVNRVWKLLFGAGLSRRLDDLGAQGEWPSHPELLDHLARRFIESGWDIKQLVKYVVMSDTYRQSSLTSESIRQMDPDNRWLARQNRYRLEAEMVRDDLLAISGLLVERIGGPSVKPYQPPGYWAYLNFPQREWQNGEGTDLYRRGLYTHWQRQYLHPALQAFDAPSREECTAERARSNTPIQSLVLLNDTTSVEAARRFAERTVKEGGGTFEERLTWAFQRALSRDPRDSEVALLHELYDEHYAQYSADPTAAEQMVHAGAYPPQTDLSAIEVATWASITRTLLNLHETITRN